MTAAITKMSVLKTLNSKAEQKKEGLQKDLLFILKFLGTKKTNFEGMKCSRLRGKKRIISTLL